MLSIHRLSCLRNNQILFSALDVRLAPTEILHVTGPNGCGKSSLLQILIGLLTPHEGEVRWQGLPVMETVPDYRAQLCYVGHKNGVKNKLTVLENLQVATKLGGKNFTHTSDWTPILQHFALENLSHRLCYSLSAGQRQRVALTRLLLTNALLWVLDEPFTSLDAATSAILQALLIRHCTNGGMVVLTSHSILDWEGVCVRRLDLG